MNDASRVERVGLPSGGWAVVSKWLGPIDLHYHFRSRPLLKFFGGRDPSEKIRVLEFGCGSGANLFALKARLPGLHGIGVDVDRAAIDQAKQASDAKGVEDLHFLCGSTAGQLANEAGAFDYILLMDVLEHLDDPTALLAELNPLLAPGGAVLVSVPTPRYPKVFGREFHEAVGHVRDGYTMSQLDELLGDRFRRKESQYNTGLIAGAACACFYRWVPKLRPRKLAIAGMIVLHLARLADLFNGKRVSCSIWAVYRSA